MRKSIKLFLFMFLLFTVYDLRFTCSNVYAASITALSLSTQDVTNAINTANDGDTVFLPAGISTWTVGISFSNKAITLKGAGYLGPTQTIIIDNTTNNLDPKTTPMYQPIIITGSLDKSFRVTQLTIIGYKDTAGLPDGICIRGTCRSWRIDHCRFVDLDTPIRVQGYTYGLIDHCTFYHWREMNCSYDSPTSVWIQPNTDTDNQWLRPLTLGTSNATYVEDCYFDFKPNLHSGNVNAFHSDGGRYVFRYNNASEPQMEQFDSCTSPGERGTISGEVYNNTFYSNPNISGGHFTAIAIAGGTGVFFNNSILGSYYGFRIETSFYRTCNANCSELPTRCDGSQPNDGNMALEGGAHTGADGSATLVCSTKNWTTNQWVSYYIYNLTDNSKGMVTANTSTTISVVLSSGTRNNWNNGDSFKLTDGYPCQDQVGRGPGPIGNQPSEPIYQWNNNYNGAGVTIQPRVSCSNPSTTDHIKLGRDYYDNTQRPGYTPYIYPHQMQSPVFWGDAVDTSSPTAPATVNDGTGANTDISFTYSTMSLSANWSAATDPDDTISKYEYAIGTTVGGTQTAGWTNNYTNLTVTKTVNLTLGVTYYFTVRAYDTSSNMGTAANSNGQYAAAAPADTTPPPNILTVRDGTGADVAFANSTTTLYANWDHVIDPESGIAKYWYAIGTTPLATNIKPWTDNGLLTTAAPGSLSLTAGSTYYFSVKAENGIGLQSSTTTSNGQAVVSSPDTTPPVLSNITANSITSSGASIIWNSNEPATGQAEYGRTISYGNLSTNDLTLNTALSAALTDLLDGTLYHYRVISRDASGNTSTSSDYTFTTLSRSAISSTINAYPNPYKISNSNPMKFRINGMTGGEASIYTISGRLIRKLSGTTEINWDGKNTAGEKTGRGIYIYKITSNTGDSVTGKIALTK